ncbi:MAG: bestrophin family ion channel [Prochlorococcaceae cyanobacterium]
MPASIRSGRHGDPPRTRRIDYGFVVLQLFWRMRLDLLVFGGLVAALVWRGPLASSLTLKPMGISVLGIAVSIFIAFRNTQAINRWWEARSLWGALVNHSRQWRDVLLALLHPDQHSTPLARNLIEYQVAQMWLLNFELRNFWRADLRRGVDRLLADLGLPAETSLQGVCRQRAMAIQRLHADGWIDGFGLQMLIQVANQCLDGIGGLQKIRNTPIPASYDVFVRLITWFYGVQLLLEFQRNEQTWVGLVLFLGFLTAERIGSYVEGPFDRDGSSFSLPLNSICSLITSDLMERPLALTEFEPSLDPTRWD